MPRQLLRVVETRRLDDPNDNRTAAEIAGTDSSAPHLEAYIQTIITQIRRIMGTVDWKDDPPTDLLSLLTAVPNFVWEEELSGTRNGVNLVFTTVNKFDPSFIRVYFNGQRLHSGTGNDFTISESGGVGTGYDTVTFSSPELAPLTGENIYADYLKKP